MHSVTFYIFLSFSLSLSAQTQTWECVARLCWGQQVAPLPPRIHNCSIIVHKCCCYWKNLPGKLQIALLSDGFTALLDKERENIQYMSIEKGKKITVGLLFPPTEALSGARIPFQRRAHTHKFIFSPPDGNKIDARCTAMETGKLSLPWRQKRVLPASSAHHNVCVRHMIIHKKEKDSTIIFF